MRVIKRTEQAYKQDKELEALRAKSQKDQDMTNLALMLLGINTEEADNEKPEL